MSKDELRHELKEKFGITDTAAFLEALQKGEIEKAKQWFDYITENRERYWYYSENWRSWSRDRKSEIEQAKSGGTFSKATRTKAEAQQELDNLFGFHNTAGFRTTIASGKLELARNWLEHIKSNRPDFPQYISTWNSWLADRERELAESGR